MEIEKLKLGIPYTIKKYNQTVDNLFYLGEDIGITGLPYCFFVINKNCCDSFMWKIENQEQNFNFYIEKLKVDFKNVEYFWVSEYDVMNYLKCNLKHKFKNLLNR
jgi:hypothetical protein